MAKRYILDLKWLLIVKQNIHWICLIQCVYPVSVKNRGNCFENLGKSKTIAFFQFQYFTSCTGCPSLSLLKSNVNLQIAHEWCLTYLTVIQWFKNNWKLKGLDVFLLCTRELHSTDSKQKVFSCFIGPPSKANVVFILTGWMMWLLGG